MSKWIDRALAAGVILMIGLGGGLGMALLAVAVYWLLFRMLNESAKNSDRRKQAESEKYRDWV